MTSFFEAASALGGEAVISLFELDMNSLGYAGVMRFCRHTNAAGTGNPVFMGNTYTTIDVEAEGFEWVANAPAPQPTLRLSNVTNIVSSLLKDYRDLVGAKLTRIRTFARYLADGDEAALAYQGYTTDIFTVERKTAHNKTMVEWKLSASIDQEGRMIPGRMVLRDNCPWRYRVWNVTTGAFDYSKATCPYNGAGKFDMNGAAVPEGARDVCSKRVETGCKPRFQGDGVLPYGGFPSVARIR